MATDQKSAALLETLLTEAIKPNAEAIARIVLKGEIALVAYEADDKWCDALGVPRKTRVDVRVLPGRIRKSMIEHGDSVTSRWLRGGRTGRVFVVMHSGSLLVNFDGASGFSLEPGSTDEEAS